MTTRDRSFQDRWTPLAGQGTLGASYLPGCPARLAASVDWEEARGRLIVLWSERAAALRFRRAVLAARTTTTPDHRLSFARLQREAFAYEAGAARLRGIAATRARWLVRRLSAQAHSPVVGAAFATMSAELAVLILSTFLRDDAAGVPRAHRHGA